MSIMPAICNICDTIFPSGFSGEGGTMFFSGCKAGPCPNCGGMGHIPDGEFRMFNNIIEVLNAPQRTLKELYSVARILEQAKIDTQQSTEEIVSEIEDELPEIAPYTSIFKNIDYKFWISILLSTIYFLIPLLEKDEKTVVEYNQVINHVYEDSNQNTKNQSPVRIEKTGRNELCYCGSEVKYKRCHGR